MAELRWTSEAEQWLKDIHEYIARENPAAAGKVIAAIYAKAQLLRTFPEIGQKYRSESEGDIRVVLYGHYRIVYLVRSAEHTIDVLGVFHGALDIERYFP